MSIAKKATIFAIAWFLIYILAYFLFIAPHFIQSQNKNNNNNNNQNNNNIMMKLIIKLYHTKVPRSECIVEIT